MKIEHVMPQTLSDEWKIHLGDDCEQTHELYLNTLGNLTLTAPDYVVLYGAFEVVQGGILSINEKEEPLIFKFSYDAAGNRILRQTQAVQ